MENQKQTDLIEMFRGIFFDLESKPDAEVVQYKRENSSTWDSANHLLLITCFEEKFDVKISDEEAIQLDSFAYAAALLI